MLTWNLVCWSTNFGLCPMLAHRKSKLWKSEFSRSNSKFGREVRIVWSRIVPPRNWILLSWTIRPWWNSSTAKVQLFGVYHFSLAMIHNFFYSLRRKHKYIRPITLYSLIPTSFHPKQEKFIISLLLLSFLTLFLILSNKTKAKDTCSNFFIFNFIFHAINKG